MPKGVKNKKLWERARAQVEKQHGSAEGRWALVTSIYQKMLKNDKKPEKHGSS
jgi:hypothetical protein